MSENKINWSSIIDSTKGVSMMLRETEIDAKHEVTFQSVKQTEAGYIVATVVCDTLEGNTLWLVGEHGLQNGMSSLMKAAETPDAIEGSTFVYTRVESEKSPAGYAHRWMTL